MQYKTTDNQWVYFKQSIRKIIEEQVPSKELTLKQSKRRGTPCDEKTLEKIQEKHHHRRKAIETKQPSVRIKYNRVRNQVRILTRSITKENERQLTENAKKKYVQSEIISLIEDGHCLFFCSWKETCTWYISLLKSC